jgi:deazaflavin-dependent oxidoreductase (nitroreductase family)
MVSKTLYHRMKALNARMAVRYRRGKGPTRSVLLLTTRGRKTGLPRTTPLQYERVGDDIYVASARGQAADWFRNILADPQVRAQTGAQEQDALAEPVTQPERIADFLELRLERHPLMLRLILHLFEGLPLHFSRADLVKVCQGKALVILHPCDEDITTKSTKVNPKDTKKI